MQRQDDPNPATPAHGSPALAETDAPHTDQFFILVVGFSFGMLIAGIFLVYIVLSAANLLR